MVEESVLGDPELFCKPDANVELASTDWVEPSVKCLTQVL